MTLGSLAFVIFVLGVVLLRAFVRSVQKDAWVLLLASYVFYISWSIPGLLLIVIVSVVDWQIGTKLGRTDDPVRRGRLLRLSLASNIGALGLFKYANFVLDNLYVGLAGLGVQIAPQHFNVALPPGISYFTFAGISYVVDVYYDRVSPCRRLSQYALYIAYFPKVLAGPIVRAREFLPQLQERAWPSVADVETGLAYFALGAVKKVVISDQIASNVDLIFATPGQFDGFTLLQGLLGYAVQIYCDFSGYSDMAIGSARIMGFKFPENFRMPYSAVTITEFWRRWHMTLSSWFRDYVFLPLEIATRGDRNPTLRASRNMMITMLLCGLWHGASWNFVFWGGLHGAALGVHRVWDTWDPLRRNKRSKVFQFVWTQVSRLLTLSVVLIGWVFFRAPSWTSAVQYLGRMMNWTAEGTRVASPYILPSVAGVVIVHLLFRKDRDWSLELPLRSVPVRIAAYSVLALLLSLFGATDAAPFIYFQF